jgi:hypothetical protein
LEWVFWQQFSSPRRQAMSQLPPHVHSPHPGNPFAEQLNPYAAPQLPAGYQPVPAAGGQLAGLWRQGNILVMHKAAPLPDICVKSNQPAQRRLKRNLHWHHPALALLILIGILVYVVVALILTKRATIMLPLTEEWYARRQRRLLIAWSWGLVSLALIVGGIALAIQTDRGEFGLAALAGFISGLAALIYGQYACSLVRPKRMTDQYIWLVGAHPDFLNRLEAWQWNI